MKPYYEDEFVTLFHGDCLELADKWTGADVLVTDPPYGIAWQKPKLPANRALGRGEQVKHEGILNDSSLEIRDAVLGVWGQQKPAVVFGSPVARIPDGTKQVLIWRKPSQLGFLGTVGGFRRDIEAIYLTGEWGRSVATRSAVLYAGDSQKYLQVGHPHSKPLAIMEQLICAAPHGSLADPFAGSGSTLVAARNLGRKVIGVELEEKYCELIAKRLDATPLPMFTEAPTAPATVAGAFDLEGL